MTDEEHLKAERMNALRRASEQHAGQWAINLVNSAIARAMQKIREGKSA